MCFSPQQTFSSRDRRAETSPVILDRAVFNETRLIMGAKFETMLDLFLVDMRARLASIAQNIGPVCDQPQLIRTAHSIMASAAQIGALYLANVAQNFEIALRGATAGESARMPAGISTALQRAFLDVEKEIHGAMKETVRGSLDHDPC